MTFKEEHKEEFHEEQEGGAMWPIIVLSRLPPVPIVLLGLWMVVDGDLGWQFRFWFRFSFCQ